MHFFCRTRSLGTQLHKHKLALRFLIIFRFLGAHVRTGTTAVQQTFNLKQLFSHESFSMRHLRSDIALLQLDRPAQLSDKVNTVCLPEKGSRVAPGTRCFVTGTSSLS